MQVRYVYASLAVVLTLLELVLSATNWEPAHLSALGAGADLPLGAMLLGSFVLGGGSLAGVWAIKTQRQVRGDQKLQQWAVQDAKLAAEMESDKIKQLQAKIATLETALQVALKKKKEKES